MTNPLMTFFSLSYVSAMVYLCVTVEKYESVDWGGIMCCEKIEVMKNLNIQQKI